MERIIRSWNITRKYPKGRIFHPGVIFSNFLIRFNNSALCFCFLQIQVISQFLYKTSFLWNYKILHCFQPPSLPQCQYTNFVIASLKCNIFRKESRPRDSPQQLKLAEKKANKKITPRNEIEIDLQKFVTNTLHMFFFLYTVL